MTQLSRDLWYTWTASRERFDDLESFVSSADFKSHGSSLSRKQHLYSSWVLLLYAALEATVHQMSQSAQRIVAHAYASPRDFKAVTRRIYWDQTLALIVEKSKAAGSQKLDVEQLEELFGAAYDSGWAGMSRLFDIEGNVWPDRVREWLDRLGPKSDVAKWMQAPVQGRSETHESVVRDLISERNQIAHGDLPYELLEPEVFSSRIAEVRQFAKLTHRSLQVSLFEFLPKDLRTCIGNVDPSVAVGDQTLALPEVLAGIKVGDLVILHEVGEDGNEFIKAADVQSLMSDGVLLSAVSPGSTEVSVGLSTSVRHATPFQSL